MTPTSPAETAELMARACPKPSLHTVEGAPIQKLADLLRTATEFVDDENNNHTPDAFNALRAAVRTLNGGGNA